MSKKGRINTTFDKDLWDLLGLKEGNNRVKVMEDLVREYLFTITNEKYKVPSSLIPHDLFVFRCKQDTFFMTSLHGGEKKPTRRYEIRENNYANSTLIKWAINLFKNEEKYDGYIPLEIHFSFEETMDFSSKKYSPYHQIHFTINEETIKGSLIYEFMKVVDYCDLKITTGILWTKPRKSPLIKSKNPRQISGTVRQDVLARDKYTCQICGATVKDGAKLEIDHIIPVSKGGTNEENNLQVLCQQCNREKHNRTDLLHDERKLAELGE